jgi:hypothetical protein
MALPAHSGPGPLIQFRNHFSQTVGRLGRETSPSQGRYLNTGQHKHRINGYTHETSMPSVGFEPTIPAPEQVKTVHALDCAVTVTGLLLGLAHLNGTWFSSESHFYLDWHTWMARGSPVNHTSTWIGTLEWHVVLQWFRLPLGLVHLNDRHVVLQWITLPLGLAHLNGTWFFSEWNFHLDWHTWMARGSSVNQTSTWIGTLEWHVVLQWFKLPLGLVHLNGTWFSIESHFNLDLYAWMTRCSSEIQTSTWIGTLTNKIPDFGPQKILDLLLPTHCIQR